MCAYTAELFAVKAALQWLTSNPHKLKDDDSIEIYTDSKSVIQVLRSTKVKCSSVEDILDLALKVKQSGILIDLKWVKGHSESTEHNISDSLARNASRQSIGIVHVPWTIEDAKAMINDKVQKLWQSRWDQEISLEKALTTKKFIKKVDMKKLKGMSELSYKDMGTLFQSITGHGLFGHHLSKWKSLDETCILCMEEVETSWHLWSECPVMKVKKKEVEVERIPLELKVLKLFNTEEIKELMNTRSNSIK